MAGGCRTDPPGEFCYYGAVCIDFVRLALFLSVLNLLQSYVADDGNDFVQGKTHEKYYIVAGPEMKELARRIL